MAEQRVDVLGIGNAIVDVLAHAEDAFIEKHGLEKGAMTLIDAEQAERLYAEMGSSVECSGGSAANTVAGIASLGGAAAFIGKVRQDQLGQIFSHDIRAVGVDFTTSPATDGPATARCLVLVTPDAQRTMNTYLGACIELTAADIEAETVGRAAVTYLEGYLWDPPAAKEAFLKARGEGISIPLDSFAVSPNTDSQSLLRQDGNPGAVAKWKLVAVNLDADFVAAVCGEGQDWELERRAWSEQ